MQSIHLRCATGADLGAIVTLLADDVLGARRERLADPLPEAYSRAYEAIAADPNNELWVAEAAAGALVGVLQITFTPYLTHQGAWRATIEGVRVASDLRGSGVGRALLERAIARAQERGCQQVQLTTDKQRADARRFYASLGFVASHEGMKLALPRV